MASKFARGLLAFVGGALAGTGEGMRENALARLKGVEAKKGRDFTAGENRLDRKARTASELSSSEASLAQIKATGNQGMRRDLAGYQQQTAVLEMQIKAAREAGDVELTAKLTLHAADLEGKTAMLTKQLDSDEKIVGMRIDSAELMSAENIASAEKIAGMKITGSAEISAASDKSSLIAVREKISSEHAMLAERIKSAEREGSLNRVQALKLLAEKSKSDMAELDKRIASSEKISASQLKSAEKLLGVSLISAREIADARNTTELNAVGARIDANITMLNSKLAAAKEARDDEKVAAIELLRERLKASMAELDKRIESAESEGELDRTAAVVKTVYGSMAGSEFDPGVSPEVAGERMDAAQAIVAGEELPPRTITADEAKYYPIGKPFINPEGELVVRLEDGTFNLVDGSEGDNSSDGDEKPQDDGGELPAENQPSTTQFSGRGIGLPDPDNTKRVKLLNAVRDVKALLSKGSSPTQKKGRGLLVAVDGSIEAVIEKIAREYGLSSGELEAAVLDAFIEDHDADLDN